MPDSLDSYLDPAPKPRNPRERVHSIASRLNIAPDLADDYLKVTQVESGHNINVRDSPKGATGFGQVMPDRPGGSTRTVGGRTYNLRNPDENIEAGLRYFAEGGSDPTERRLYYFGGPKARERYRRTGRIPNISDGNLTAAQYVAATGGRQARQSQPQSDLDRYLDPSPSGQTQPASERRTQIIPQSSNPPVPPKQPPLSSVPSRARQGGGIFGRREVQEAVRRGVQQPVQSSTGSGDLRRATRGDEARTQRLLQLQREETTRATGSRTLRYMGTSPGREPARAARVAAERLSAEEADTARRQRLEPEVSRLTEQYRKQIREAQNRGIGPEQWLNETAAKGVAGLLELGGGMARASVPGAITRLATGKDPIADSIEVHAAALQRAAEAEGADRSYISQATQNILAGTVSTAPEMVATSLGVPAPIAFGAGGATRSVGRGEQAEQIAKSGLHGAATGAVFEIPGAVGIRNPLAKVGTIGVGTGAVEAASGQPLSKAVEAGVTNALLAGAGEVAARRSRPKQAPTPRNKAVYEEGKDFYLDELRENSIISVPEYTRLAREKGATEQEVQAAVEARAGSGAMVEPATSTAPFAVDDFTVGSRWLHPDYTDGVPFTVVERRGNKAVVERYGERVTTDVTTLQEGLNQGALTRAAPRERAEPDAEIAARLRGEREPPVQEANQAVSPRQVETAGARAVAAPGQDIPGQRRGMPENTGANPDLDKLPDVKRYLDEPQIQTKPPVEPGPLFAKGDAGRRSQQVLDAIAATADKDAYVIAGGQRLKVQQSNYGMFGRVIGHEVQLADGTIIDASIIQRVEDGNGRVLFEAKPPVEVQRAEVESAARSVQPETSTRTSESGGLPEPRKPQDVADAPPNLENIAPARFYHRDFGAVTESPNQRRVGKGRVRVIDESGAEHVIKRAAMTGRGNERAVPVREMPVEPSATPLAPVKPLPELRDNFRKPLREYADTLYRETSADGALDMLPTARRMTDVGDVYLSNTPDLALGQGRNKGILLEFDPAGLEGQVNRSKPAWEALYQQGQAEFIARYNRQGQYKDALKSVTLKPDLKMSHVERIQLDRALREMEDAGWIKTQTAEGVLYRRPEKPTTEPVPAPVPERVEEVRVEGESPARESISPEALRRARDLGDQADAAYIATATERLGTPSHAEAQRRFETSLTNLREAKTALVSEWKARGSVSGRELLESADKRLRSEYEDYNIKPDDIFELQKVKLSELKLQGEPMDFTPDPGSPPSITPGPIVLSAKRDIIDGTHRVKEAFGRGEEAIEAWVPRGAKLDTGTPGPKAVEPQRPSVTKPVTEPPPPSATAAKRASMSADRAALDLPELPPAERKSWRRSLSEARPETATRLADEVLNRPRALSDSETASLVVRAQQVKNEHAARLKEIADATDDTTIQSKRAELETLEREFDQLTQATKLSGTEKGRALAAQKLTINQDYDLVSLVARFKASAGRAPTARERTRIEELSRRNAELEAKLTEANDRLANQRIQKEIDRTQRRSTRTETKAQLDAEWADLTKQFAEIRQREASFFKSEKGEFDPASLKLISRMVRNRVQAGVVNATQLVDDIHAIVGGDKRELRDTISGYRTQPAKQQSDLQRQLNALKSELRQLSSTEDIVAGRRAPRQEGPQAAFRRDTARQRALRKQITDLEAQMTSGQFRERSTPEPPRYTAETLRLQKQLEDVRMEYERMKYRATASTTTRLGHEAVKAINSVKTLKSIGDISAVFRQGGFYGLSHPLEGLLKPSKAMLDSFTELGYRNVEAAIKADPAYDTLKRAGVEFTGVDPRHPHLSLREEGYLGGEYLDYIPGLKQVKNFSERTFVSFLDAQRLSMGKQMLDALTPEQRANPKELQSIAKLINAGTGRGNLGARGNSAAPVLNLVMFSPRLLASRVQLLNNMISPRKLATMPPGVRKRMIADNVKFLAATTLILGLAKAAGAGINLDPDDSDFLKIRAGNTTYDTLTGLQQPLRYFISMGRAIKADITGDETYAGQSKGELTGRFARSKLSPSAGTALDYVTGKDFMGRKFNVKTAAKELVMPLPAKDVTEAMQKEGLWGGAKATPTFVGIGVGNYPPPAERAGTHAEKLARRMVIRRLPDEARTQEEIDIDTKRSELRARARRGEDVSADIQALGPKITDRQAKAILAARNRTRLQEDVNRLGIKDALLVYSVANSQQRAELKSLLTRKADLVATLPPDEQVAVIQKLNEYGLSGRGIRISRPSRASRESRQSR